MAVRVFLDPQPLRPDVYLADILYAEAVPRLGDHVRVSARLHTGGSVVLSGPVTKVMTEVSEELDGSYVVVTFNVE